MVNIVLRPFECLGPGVGAATEAELSTGVIVAIVVLCVIAVVAIIILVIICCKDRCKIFRCLASELR